MTLKPKAPAPFGCWGWIWLKLLVKILSRYHEFLSSRLVRSNKSVDINAVW